MFWGQSWHLKPCGIFLHESSLLQIEIPVRKKWNHLYVVCDMTRRWSNLRLSPLEAEAILTRESRQFGQLLVHVLTGLCPTAWRLGLEVDNPVDFTYTAYVVIVCWSIFLSINETYFSQGTYSMTRLLSLQLELSELPRYLSHTVGLFLNRSTPWSSISLLCNFTLNVLSRRGLCWFVPSRN